MAAGRAYMNALEDDDVVLGPQNSDGGSSDVDSMGGETPGAQEQKPDDKQEVAPKKRAAGAPRPALTLSLLQDQHKGFNHLFQTFPDVLRQGFKGKGHEVADLQRLLEMYSRWHRRIFPYCSFDEFISKVEKFGSQKELKAQMKQLRQELITLLDDPDAGEQEDVVEVQDQQQETGTQAQPWAAGQPAVAPVGSGLTPPAAAAVRPPVAPAAAPVIVAADDDEMDELLEMDMEADMQWDAAMDVLDEWDAEASAPQRPAPAAAQLPAAAQGNNSAAPAPGDPTHKPVHLASSMPDADNGHAQLGVSTEQLLEDEDVNDDMDAELMRHLEADGGDADAGVAPTQPDNSHQQGTQQHRGAAAAAAGGSDGDGHQTGYHAGVQGLEDDEVDVAGQGSQLAIPSQVVRSRVRAVLLDDDDE